MIQAKMIDLTLTASAGPRDHPWCNRGRGTVTPARPGPLPHLTALPEKQVVEDGVGLGSLEENGQCVLSEERERILDGKHPVKSVWA